MPKFLLILFIALAPMNSLASGDVYYCSYDDATGFVPQEGFKVAAFELRRFTAHIDFEAPMATSEKLWLKDDVKCSEDNFNSSIYCMSNWGSTFVISRDTLKFYYSSMFMTKVPNDTVVMAHGKCEKF